MSSSAMVYALKVDDLQALIGSNRNDVKPEGDVDPDVLAAFEDLIAGRTRLENQQHYVDALEHLCRFQGRMMMNAGLAPTDVDTFERVNDALEARGLGFDLHDLVYGGSPIQHPNLVGARSVGWVPLAKLEHAKALVADDGLSSDESDIDEAFFSIEGWIDQATSRGEDLIGFFY